MALAELFQQLNATCTNACESGIGGDEAFRIKTGRIIKGRIIKMQLLTSQHIISIIATLLLVTVFGIYSGKKVKTSSDFAVGGKKANWPIIAGTIIGTLVGGSSTIGTAQMAYLYGFSAWWFTLGGGIGCLILSIFFTEPLWLTGAKTVPEIISKEFGGRTSVCSSIFSSLGIFLNIISQVLAITALFSTVFNLKPLISAVIGVFLMANYVIFGGVWGTGLIGVLKTVLLYTSMIIAGLLAYTMGGGISGFREVFPAFPWFSLFGRGFLTDFAAGFSLVIGVLATQTYIQAVISGKDVRSSKIGSMISAILVVPIGLAGIFIGLFMRNNFPNIDPGKAFPLFVLKYLNPWIGGVVLATLIIAVVGTGAGLALGVSTVLTNDIYKRYLNKTADDKNLLKVSRILIVAVLGITLLFVYGNLGSLILQWAILSMGLRGTAALIPMIPALFFKGKVTKKAGFLCVLLGPISVLLWKIFFPDIGEPLYIGLLVGVLILFLGGLANKKDKTKAM